MTTLRGQGRNTWSAVQAHVLKVQIETLRRLKYRPTGGFCFSSLNDPAPAISSSILDHERRPKAAYETVRAACAPVLVVADPLPDDLHAKICGKLRARWRDKFGC